MLAFQYVWKYIISVIGTSRLSLIHMQFKSPNSYEIAFDKYRESLSCPHPPMHDNIMYQRSHRLAIWRYEKWPYRLTLPHTHTHTHTHTESLRSLYIGCLFWALYLFEFCVLDRGPRIVSPELCLLAACPDLPPGTRLCLCLTPAVLPCRYLTLYFVIILNKSCKWIQTFLTLHNGTINLKFIRFQLILQLK